jgi:hypothetical protein
MFEVLLLQSATTFVSGWPEITAASSHTENHFDEPALGILTYDTVAVLSPASGSLVTPASQYDAHGTATWEYTVDPESGVPHLTGEVMIDRGEFTVAGSFDAVWCEDVVGFPPC